MYIDPWKLGSGGQADLILISHSHYDHYSQEEVNKLRGPQTVVVTVAELAPQVGGKVETLAPGRSLQVGDVKVEGVAAYNINKKFHPRANGWLGFVVELGGRRIYYAGDTDLIPEMSQLGRIDVALLPVGGTYTMNAEEAAEAARRINPVTAVPYHWGDIVGSRSDASRFAELYKGRTEILQPFSG